MSVASFMPIIVTDHAMWRAAERFRGFDTVTIEDEVRAALAAGRCAKKPPSGVEGLYVERSIYVWTEDGSRVYALNENREGDGFVVATTIRATR